MVAKIVDNLLTKSRKWFKLVSHSIKHCAFNWKFMVTSQQFGIPAIFDQIGVRTFWLDETVVVIFSLGLDPPLCYICGSILISITWLLLLHILMARVQLPWQRFHGNKITVSTVTTVYCHGYQILWIYNDWALYTIYCHVHSFGK